MSSVAERAAAETSLSEICLLFRSRPGRARGDAAGSRAVRQARPGAVGLAQRRSPGRSGRAGIEIKCGGSAGGRRLHRRLPAADRLGRSGIGRSPSSPCRPARPPTDLPTERSIAADVVPRPHRRCNNYDPARCVPLLAGGDRIGLVRRDNAEALRRFPEVFAVGDDRVALVAQGDADAVSRAVDRVVDALVARKADPEDPQRDVRCRRALGRAADLSPRPRSRPVFRHARLRGAPQRVSSGRGRADGRLALWVGRRAPRQAGGAEQARQPCRRRHRQRPRARSKPWSRKPTRKP